MTSADESPDVRTRSIGSSCAPGWMVRRGGELSPPIGREVRRPYFVAVGRFNRQHSSLKELVGVLVAEGDRVPTVERHFECHEDEPAMKAGPKAGVSAWSSGWSGGGADDDREGRRLMAVDLAGRETRADSPLHLFPQSWAAGWSCLSAATAEGAERVRVGADRVRVGAGWCC